MPLRVGFDLDGTVADMHSALRREAVKLFGEEVLRKAAQKPQLRAGSTIEAPAVAAESAAGSLRDRSADPEDDTATNQELHELHLNARQQMQLWEHVKKINDFWMTLSELEPGIISRIAKAAADRRWEVIFLTTRPSTAGELVQLQSQRWLESNGFRYPSVYVVQRSRGRIADALHLDAFVDDRPENCLDIAVESKAKVILIWQGDLADVPPGAKRLGVRAVTTIGEAVDLLEQLDDVRNKPGFVRTLKRAFGSGE
jgi:FMN phosphatase YigB (HAD superfamily)